MSLWAEIIIFFAFLSIILFFIPTPVILFLSVIPCPTVCASPLPFPIRQLSFIFLHGFEVFPIWEAYDFSAFRSPNGLCQVSSVSKCVITGTFYYMVDDCRL